MECHEWEAFLPILILAKGDQFLQQNFCSKIGPARSVLAAKVVQGTTLTGCFATFGPARPILVGTNFGGLKIFPE